MVHGALPGIDDIRLAARRIAGVASVTPLVESPVLSRLSGREVYLKLECFQPIKVFKIRGAYNKISQTPEKSVVAASSGNHGIAVAYTSRLLGKRATVVVPETAVKEKVDKIHEYGAGVVRFGNTSGEREAKGREIAKASSSAFIHPFDDPDVISGQGTCGLEISERLQSFDSVVVPVGGGGLISGISIALKALRPQVRVYGVEPEGAAKLSASLKAGKLATLDHPSSVADGLLPTALGRLTYAACKMNVDGAFAVTERDILEATRVLARDVGIFAEPSGAAAIAPILSRQKGLGKSVVAVISGGNISQSLLVSLLKPSQPGRGQHGR
jgi:threonine dehydratase